MRESSSANYVWCTSFALGTGATSAVYQGVNKKTGELVAVKTFNRGSYQRLLESQMREFEVMRTLDHKNIVKMLAVEEEVSRNPTKMKVIIMELGNGGSLQDILKDPENSYGLEEEEFLRFLKHISDGMKYLKEKEIMHRDLKPGNILRHISEDKSSIYKITDFGAAKYLPPGQEFTSIYGTAEYLHPDMYARGFLKQGPETFKDYVDLWSIGVTLYHVATGSLPFRPYLGRNDTRQMFDITSTKESGVISGIQYSENGSIEWSKELPETCQLSKGLKDLLCVLLAGILEHTESMWSFDQFFDYVEDINSRKVFHVFYMNEGKEIRLYLKSNEGFQDLKDQIFSETGVPSPEQLLFFEKTLLTSESCASTFLFTTVNQPLLLMHMKKAGVEDCRIEHLKKEAKKISFPTTKSKSISGLAQKCCIVAYDIRRLNVKLVRSQEHLLKFPEICMSLIENNVSKLVSDSDALLKEYENASRLTNILEKSSLALKGISNMEKIIPEHNQMTGKIEGVKSAIQLLKKASNSGELQIKWKKAERILSESNFTGYIQRADTYIESIRSNWKIFCNEERNGNMNEMFHSLEVVKLKRNCRKLDLLKEECLKSCMEALVKMNEWLKPAWDLFLKSSHFEDLVKTKNDLKHYCSSLMKAESELCALCEKSAPLRLCDIKLIQEDNKEFSKILKKQTSLLKRFDSLRFDMGPN